MSKTNGYVNLDNELRQFLPKDRPYTPLEAMFSHQLDVNKGNSWSIAGYAKQWQWHWDSVKRFIDGIYSNDGYRHNRYSQQPNVHVIEKAIREQSVSNTGAARQDETNKNNDLEKLSVSNTGAKREQSVTTLKKKKKKENKTTSTPIGVLSKNGAFDDPDSAGEKPQNPKILFDIFCEENRVLPQPRSFTPDRRKKCKTRLGKFRKLEDIEIYLDNFRLAVEKCQQNDFLNGTRNRWKATFDWLIENDKNLIKVLEGNYD